MWNWGCKTERERERERERREKAAAIVPWRGSFVAAAIHRMPKRGEIAASCPFPVCVPQGAQNIRNRKWRRRRKGVYNRLRLTYAQV